MNTFNFHNKLTLLFLLGLVFHFNGYASNDTFGTKTEQKPPIKLGTTLVLSGINKAIGANAKQGIEVLFFKVNAAGGIQGRKLELVALDDGYNAKRAAENVYTFINNSEILALIGVTSTTNNLVILPIVNEHKILLYAPFSGAEFMRKTPPDRYVINFRAGHTEELKGLIESVLEIGIKPEEIAFFLQNDAFGDSVYDTAIAIMKEKGVPKEVIAQMPKGRYTANTLNVESALATIIQEAKHAPKAIILGGTKAPVAKFIDLAIQEFPNVLFFATSGNTDLFTETFSDKAIVIVTEIVPNIDSDLPGVKEYRENLQAFAPGAQPNSRSLAAYLSAKLLVIALEKATTENKLSREGIIDTLESLKDIDLGIDLKISLDKNQHQALHKVWPVQLYNKKYSPYNSTTLKEMMKNQSK